MPKLVLTGANKGGVGKTTTAHLLMLHALASGQRWRAFDAQPPAGSLRRFIREAELVDFSSTKGRMRVLDGLEDATTTMVDLPAGLLSETLQLLSDTGALADAATGALKLTVVHVLAPNVDSLSEAADVAARLAEGGKHVLVKCCANSEKFEWDEGSHARYLSRIAPAAVVNIPHLNDDARGAVDERGSSYDDFIKDESQSQLLRRLVRKWRADCFAEFDKANFRELFQ